ncbi:hypothetical protein Rhopal_005406-T1 [Rhodotorula paludigena]|uniref:Dienelactone hydrolase domain-containing protein n=1 Tax=Rhodotorula paludigena TaxID=86838 RepID=A0AAV5GIG2_9BASI|nr:hypothetical protein Rhopal_005406-T1 [Rhodotorula paludigena]
MSAASGATKPCADCLKGYRLEGGPKGKMAELDGVSYYLAEGPKGDKERAIVLASDLFGFGLPNTKLVADWFAENTGLSVFVPDLFEGDYIDTSVIQSQLDAVEEPMKEKTFFGRIAAKLSTSLKTKMGYQRLGLVGYCFGGSIAVWLAASDSPIDVSVCYHPSRLTLQDFEAIRKPFMLVCAEEDMSFDGMKPSALVALDKVRSKHSIPVQVWDDNAGTTHGFGCRPNMKRADVRESYEKSNARTKAWFEEHL